MSAVDDTPTQFRGNLTAVAEELTLTDREVIGEIPAELDGRYVRNGPNPITAEDDRYLMTYVFDAESHTSECAIFDASTMSSDPVAAVKLPRVPLGFHGNWVPSTQSD